MKNCVATLSLCVSLFLLFAPAADAQTMCASVTLSRTSFYSGSNSAFWSVKVTTPTPSCAWDVTISRGVQDTSAWLILNGDTNLLTASGTGTGTFTLKTLPNTTGVFRYGSVSIAGVTYKVTQERAADSTPPTVTIVAPTANAMVASTIAITANATDNIGVKGVQFKVDGINVGPEDVTAPYTVSWDTTQVSDGPHTITAVARDGIGNSSNAVIGVVVKNVPDPPPPPAPPAPVSNLAPANAATDQALSLTLSWTPTNATSYAVLLGTSNPPAIAIASELAATNFVATSLAHSTTYFWQVVARNEGGETPGAVWSFTTSTPTTPVTIDPPGVPTLTAPEEASTVTPGQVLRWAATGATSYELKFGAGNPPTEVIANLVEPTHTPVLAYATTYYWQVVAKNTGGSTEGPVWTFTTGTPPPPPAPPAVPVLTSPADASTVPLQQALAWTAAGATSYDVRLGTTNPPTEVIANPVEATHTPVLAYATTYYWQVVAKNTGGSTEGAVWSFTTSAPPPPPPPVAPGVPVLTSPADASTVSLQQTLSWTASGATSYDVRLGTANPPTSVIANVTEATHTPALVYATTYYWQVVAKNNGGSTEGPVWSFTTQSAPPPSVPANNTALKRLRIVTWNVQFGYNVASKHDFNSQIDMLASLNPDVIVLQEVTLADFDMPTTFKRGLETRTGKTWSAMFVQSIAGAPRANSQGNMILTWLPVDQATSKRSCAVPNDDRRPAEGSCTAIVTYAVTVNSVPLTITTAHLNVRSVDYRTYQLADLAAWLDTFGPDRIVAGDFNMEPPDPLWANWAPTYADVWAGVVGTTGDLGYTKDERTLTKLPGRIDYMFIPQRSTRIAVQSFAVVKTALSDHHLLVGDYIVK